VPAFELSLLDIIDIFNDSLSKKADFVASNCGMGMAKYI
jgi:hypothetical protein